MPSEGKDHRSLTEADSNMSPKPQDDEQAFSIEGAARAKALSWQDFSSFEEEKEGYSGFRKSHTGSELEVALANSARQNSWLRARLWEPPQSSLHLLCTHCTQTLHLLFSPMASCVPEY